LQNLKIFRVHLFFSCFHEFFTLSILQRDFAVSRFVYVTFMMPLLRLLANETCEKRSNWNFQSDPSVFSNINAIL